VGVAQARTFDAIGRQSMQAAGFVFQAIVLKVFAEMTLDARQHGAVFAVRARRID